MVEVKVVLSKKSVQDSSREAEQAFEATAGKIKKNLETKLNQDLAKGLNAQLGQVNESLKQVNQSIEKNSGKEFLGGFTQSVGASSKVLAGFSAAAIVAEKSQGLFQKGLFSTTFTMAKLSVVLTALGSELANSENAFTSFIGKVALLVGVGFGGLATAISIAIIKVAQFSQEIGTKLVGVFDSTSKAFVKFEQNFAVFDSLVANFNKLTNGAVGSTESWENEINSLSNTLNLTNDALIKSSAEIVQVTSQMGFQEDQMKKLLHISAEYAKVNHKDVFDTTVAVVAALNGNAQAVQALGIKLGEAAVQQYAYKNGIDRSIASMSEQEKSQLRYNKLLSQYKNISGVAEVAANSLGDSQNRLLNITTRFQQKLGEGAAIVEQNNIILYALTKTLDLVSDNVIAATGFLGALGARVLQIGGFYLEWSLKIFAVYKAYQILDALLKASEGMRFLDKTIPLINKSFNELIGNMGATKVSVNSANSLFQLLGTSLKNIGNNFSQFAFGLNLGQVSIKNLASAIGGRLVTAFGIVKNLAFTAVRFLAPFLLKLGLIVLAVKAVFKVFETLEEKTGVFSKLKELVGEFLERITTEAGPIFDFFNKIIDKITYFGNVVLGFFVVKLADFLSFIIKLAAKNPFKIFNVKELDGLKNLQKSLDDFSEKAKNVGYDLRELKDNIERKPASNNIMTVSLEQLSKLKEELKDIGKSDVQKISQQLNERLALVEAAYSQELLKTQEFLDLKNKIMLDAQMQAYEKIKALTGANGEETLTTLIEQETKTLAQLDAFKAAGLVKEAEYQQTRNNIVKYFLDKKNDIEYDAATGTINITKQANNALLQITSQTMQMLGKSLISGGGSFQAFLGIVLNALGDMAIAIGTTVIASSKAIDALKASIVGSSASAIVLGGALIAVGAAMKAMGSKISGDSASIGSTGSVGGGGVAIGPNNRDKQDTSVFIDKKEKEKTGTNVQVVVQGDIMDSEETGTRIAKILSDSFGKQGIVLTDARTA